MMKTKMLMALAVAATCVSCNDNEMFEKEMYKNVVALISSDYYNIFEENVALPAQGDVFTGYIAACAGGTHATEKDIVVTLENDDSQLDVYNRSLYDVDETKYAKQLTADRYEIPDYKITIKAGERTGKTMIKIRPEGLSPDSAYFVGLKAQAANGVELNGEKNTILYRVYLENEYASQKGNDYYKMTGMVNGLATAGSKRLLPLTHNSVRMVAGTETFKSNVTDIANNTVVLVVDEENRVTIKPYKNLQVTQIDDDPIYQNIYYVEESYGHVYKVFMLAYKYIINGKEKIVQEALRLETTNE